MVKVQVALSLASVLERIDMDIMRGVTAYSHAAQRCSPRVVAIAADPAATGEGAAACRRIVREHDAALANMIEDVEDSRIDAHRRAAVEALEAAGLTSGYHGGWACLRAARFLVQDIRDLGVAGQAIVNGTNPAWGRERAAALITSLTARGVDCTGYIPDL